MQPSPPFISVIIPTHRRAHLLARAISSIRNGSPDTPLEIIVVSDAADAGTDQTCNELLSNQDTYIRRSGPPGPSASRNIGLDLARGQVILFLDDDDAWQSGLAARLASDPVLRSGRSIYFNCSIVKERRLENSVEILGETPLSMAGRLTEDVYLKNQVHMSCFAFPNTLVRQLRFDPTMRAYEDWDFQLAVYDQEFPQHVDIDGSRVFEVDDETTDRRGSSSNATNFNAVLDYLYVYRRHPAPSAALRAARASLLRTCGLNIEDGMF